jgi:hypothetical protein
MGRQEQFEPESAEPEKAKPSILRRFVVPAALVGAGVLAVHKALESSPEPEVKPVPAQIKKVERSISFAELGDLFRVEDQIPGQPMIAHIDKWHEVDGSLEATRRQPGGLDRTISSQKAQRIAIRHLVGQGVRHFFVEGVGKSGEDWYLKLSKDIQDFKAFIARGDVEPLLAYIYDNNKTWADASAFRDTEHGQAKYFILCRVKDVLEAAGRGRVVLNREKFEKLSALRTELENDPLIIGDNALLWGADFVELAEYGDIVIHQTEDDATNDQLAALFERKSKTNPGNTQELAEMDAEEAHLQNIREDKALGFMLRFIEANPKVKTVPILQGGGHYFIGNFKKLQALGRAKGVGIKKLHNISDDLFLESIKKDPRYRGVDLGNEADKAR